MVGLFVFTMAASALAQKTIVDKYGALSVKGKYIIGQFGDTVQLRGMSMFWSQWMGQYYNKQTIKWLRDDWKCTIVRAAMGVDNKGYLDNPQEEKENVYKVVDAAIELGIYVIIDFHSHDAYHQTEESKKFFSEMAKKYGKYPNVLYEIFNEPLQDISWSKDIKPYEEEVIKTIRKYDPDNIVIAGTRRWSQLVYEAALDPLSDVNTVYTLHFYAASHGKDLIAEAQKALDKGVALFVSEFGTCDYSGNGELDLPATKVWLNFLDINKISWCNWSVADKDETASALNPGASDEGNWKAGDISPSGTFIRGELIRKNGPLLAK
jgi:endoglucanase